MALVADGGRTHVWVSSPIRACVEGLLGREVNGSRVPGEPYGSDVLRDCAWLTIELKSGEPRDT